jgi:hypothetical protein
VRISQDCKTCFKNPKRMSRISLLDVTHHNKNFCSYCNSYLPEFREVLRNASAIFVHTMYVTELELTLWDIAPFCVIAASRDGNDSQISESWLIPKPNKVHQTHSALHMWDVIVVKCSDIMNEGCTPTRLHDVTFRMTVLLSLRRVNLKYPAVTWQEGMNRICTTVVPTKHTSTLHWN